MFCTRPLAKHFRLYCFYQTSFFADGTCLVPRNHLSKLKDSCNIFSEVDVTYNNKFKYMSSFNYLGDLIDDKTLNLLLNTWQLKYFI